MSPRHTRVVAVCLSLLLMASLAFILAVPQAVERTAFGDDPDLSQALQSPEYHAWQRSKSRKLVQVAEIYAAVELGDREVEQRFPGLSHPTEGSSALGDDTDPAEILDEALRLDPENALAAVFLAEICLHRDARGTLHPARRAWLLQSLDRFLSSSDASAGHAHLRTLGRLIDELLESAPAGRMVEVREWWAGHAARLQAAVGDVVESPFLSRSH